MDDMQIVYGARDCKRRTAVDYIQNVVDDFMEFHGDRYFGDDPAVVGGIGRIGRIAVTVIGIEKGKTTQERIRHHFGCAHPEGYRKSLRLMEQAEKFHRPILCFVDTAGAFCGVEAEERGQGRAIADNLARMSDLKVPILSVIIGEGGSGGALALCHGDQIWMLEDAYFSVVSPENCANILWKTTKKADLAAGVLGLTAQKLMHFGLIDRILPAGGGRKLASELEKELGHLLTLTPEQLVEKRYKKFRKVGYGWD